MRKNNKGVSMVTVIVIAAIAAIMVSLVLYSASLNYQMKITNVKGKAAFYSAETAVDEIKAGLMQLESNALKHAYTTVLEQYGSLTSAQRKELFTEEYKNTLAAALKDPASPTQYKVDQLQSYLVDTVLTLDGSGNPVSGAKVSYKSTPDLYVNSDKIIIKNLVVTFYGETDSASIVETDIALYYPQADFEESAVLPGLSEFALIAAQGIQAEGAVNSKIQGGVYAGTDGFQVDTGAIVNVTAANLFVSASDVNVEKSAKLNIDNSTSVWAKNINVDNATLEIDGSAYVSNDLILGKNADVTLKGTYYGYGNPESAQEATSVNADLVKQEPSEYSSAILINGVKSKLNMLGLERLMLAGNAYVGTKERDTVNNLSNISMGESLGIKSNQLIYLVPSNSIGVANDGSILESGGCNPMPAERYEALKSEIQYDLLQAYGSESEVLSRMGVADMDTAIKKAMVSYYTVDPEVGSSLSEVGVTSYKTAFYPNGSSSTVYLYMIFDTKQAENEYFRNYCSRNTELVKRYLDVYADSIEINDTMESVVLNGNMVFSKENGLSIIRDNFLMESLENRDYIKFAQAEYQDTFAALKSALNENYNALTVDERAKTPFENLVNVDAIKSGRTAVSSGGQLVFNGTRSGNACIIVNNEGGSAFVLDSSVSASEGIIIATGDVQIRKNFRGLIIAKGKATIHDSANVTADGEAALDAMMAEDTVEALAAVEYFNYAGEHMTSGGTGSVGGGEKISLSDLIQVENWRKK